MNHGAAWKAMSCVALIVGVASLAGCDGATEAGPTAAVPAVSPTVPLPSQVGKSLYIAIGTAVTAHYGYGLSQANGKGQLEHVTPKDWKVCFQKAGPLGDSVIFGVVRTQEPCPDRWIDKL
ncbi:hypothetical protein [Streptomyces sp. NBC_00328]|uniref:hypothetical protein n=1 Tax=Streptomyces sp. NBC_00328 TaxID=2903646 RepID=UPI002E2DC675|nr:hypothetical protein [Streptomyces sp. NBC_00328]